MADVLTVQQLAEEFGLAKSTIYLMVAEGRIPHVKFGSAIRFRRPAIEAWIAAQEGQSQPSGRRQIPAFEAAQER